MAIFAYGGLPRSRAASVFREIQRGGYQRIKSTIVVPSGSSGTVDQTYTTTYATVGMPTNFIGQSFQVSTTGYLRAIVVRGIGNGTGTGTFTLRYGNNIDLTTYWGEVQLVNESIEQSEAKTLTFTISDTTHQVSAGNTYYFAVSEASGEASLQAYMSGSSGYSSGTGYYSADANKWDLTGHDETGDLSFDVLLCD